MMRNLIACALAVLVGGLAWGEESVAVAAKPKAAIARPRYIPEEGPKHKWWMERHEAKLAEAKALGKEIDLVFIGDSITHGWEGHGKDVLAELRQTYSVLPLGYNGDSTPNTIWRLQNGELDGYRAKLVMLMLGTNNYDRPEDVLAGMKEIVALIRAKQPQATLLLLAIFPRDERPDGPSRQKNDRYNALLKTLADGQNVVWLDLASVFTTPEGVLPKAIFPDSLHPLKPGYERWKNAVLPYFKKAVGK